ncbi:MAG: hypothetical protein DRN61_04840 [Thaumarchaeota archaeon]|nr:MAG: hypothetical protein DRN61_04840 [Nitrososphaerota archaeon]HDD43157.1 hypothetical protein [Nitrososphaeria archaeon]
MLETRLKTLMNGVGGIKVSVEVPRVILERKPIYIKVSEKEFLGRIILLALDGFFDDWRSAGAVASEFPEGYGWRVCRPGDLFKVREFRDEVRDHRSLTELKIFRGARGSSDSYR